jgi:hypothetical protein
MGRYRPLRQLGSGGAGAVWLARDEATGRDVTLKIVRREGKAGARAEREAVAASRLRHPRCLRAYGLVQDERDVVIAYEHVPGRTVREALRAGELGDAAAVEVAAQVLEGLAHAHARGIVHRDVKPANVLLADGPELSVRVLDFGLARIDALDTLTAAGDVPGTLAYIAPERLTGRPATPASDVYSVGVMLWEALAGEHPFWRTSLPECVQAIGDGAPPLRELRPDLPPALAAAVDRSLSADPRKRPPAHRLAAVLRRAAREPRRPSEPERRRGPRDLRLPERLLTAALAAAVVGWTTATLPFYPEAWPLWLALGAGAVAALDARAGLALALFAPVFPLGNVSLGLALVYAAVAVAWLALFLDAPRDGLLFAVAPLLAPLAALGLVPLALARVRSGIRRAAAAGAGVLVAAVVAGVAGSPLPLAGAPAPQLGLVGSEDAAGVAAELAHALGERPELLAGALALALAAAALPLARRAGPWGLAGFGAATLAALLLAAPAAPVAPLVAAVWLTCGLLAALSQPAGEDA